MGRNIWVCYLASAIIAMQLFSACSATYVYGEPAYKCPERKNIIYPCVCSKGSDEGLFVVCQHTNLATLSTALQNLAALDNPIEHLTIRKANIARLYGPIFSKLKARQLVIEDTSLSNIEEYAFHGINKTLEVLHILQSNLTTIKPLSFGNLGKLVQLRIDGHSLTTVAKDLFANQEISNHLETIRIANGLLNDIPIETFQPLRKLKLLDLHGNNLETLKRNQFKNLRSVEVLDISFNKIKKLEAQHISDMTKLGWCNISNNALTELTRGTFARNSVLKVLNMAHNNITRLDVNSFRGMRFLRRLYMSDNRINEVGRGTFGSITRIGTIDLARNSLQKVEFQMFSQLNYVEVLNMAENNITIVEKNAFKDIYQAVINISHNALATIEPYAFENCVNITILDLSHNQLKNFSKNVFDTTTFANEFQLSYNYLTNLAQIPIQNMTGIKILNASHNYITQIPKNSFPKLYELHTIDISHNNLTFIANGVFQTLFSLRFINLSHNNMTEIKSSTFGTLPTVLELDLSYNILTSIVRGALAKMTSLRVLKISNNKLEKLFQIPISLNELILKENNIKELPSGTWPVMNSLISLDLSYNQIGDSLQANSFKGLLVLQKLRLDNNGVTYAPSEALAGASTVQYIHLENNNITVLAKNAFGKLPVLFELNLYNNGIADISKRAFEGLLQLLTLNLSANSITTIPNDAFTGLPSLRNLDLSFNNIVKLDNKTNGVLDDLLSLENLNLSHNKITFVTKKTFPSNQYIPYNLKKLDLSYNQMPVLTYDMTFGTKKLLQLNLSYNNINDIRRDVLSNLTSLRIIDLSNNELSNLLEEHTFDLPKNLTEIYLQNNHIFRIPFESFDKLNELQLIDLRNNSLHEFPEILVSILRNGTQVLFAGNMLHCSCSARPLKHFAMEQTNITNDFQNIICSTPMTNSNQSLNDVLDENLQCILEERGLYNSTAYSELPDIRFRDIKLTDNNKKLLAKWFVTSAKDIADFTLYLRSSENKIIYQTELPYNQRSEFVPINEHLDKTNNLYDFEICIIARDSSGTTGRWFSDQCQKLPVIKSKYKFFGNGASPKYFGGCVLLITLSHMLLILFRYRF